MNNGKEARAAWRKRVESTRPPTGGSLSLPEPPPSAPRGSAAPTRYSWACICLRPSVDIVCPSCGFMAFGRVRRKCPAHPKVTFLMDLAQCPRPHCEAECIEIGPGSVLQCGSSLRCA